MKCEKCNNQLHYGDKFCNTCGEKIPANFYEEDYKHTIWGFFDSLSEKWDKLFLKKITDHIIFKIVVVALILLGGFFEVYTDVSNIKLLKSDEYKIEYNKKEDEYYFRTDKEEVDLRAYIPRHADEILIKEFDENGNAEEKYIPKKEYSERRQKLHKGEYVYVTVSSVKGKKVTDTVKIYLTD